MTKQEEKILQNKNIDISTENSYIDNINMIINEENAFRYEENKILLVLTSKQNGQKYTKVINFYYDKEERKIEKKDFVFTLYHRELPRANDKRVNTNESIKNIQYRVENNTTKPLEALIRVRIHHILQGADMLEHIGEYNVTISPLNEEIVKIGDLHLSEDKYLEWLKEGTLELRADLISVSDIGEIEKGDKLSSYKFRFYFNRNEKRGVKDSFKPLQIDKPDKHHRSWVERESNEWIIYLNIGHKAFKESERYHYDDRYMTEQLLKRFIDLYIEDAKYSILGLTEKDIENISASEFYEKINDKIELLYYKYLNGNDKYEF